MKNARKQSIIHQSLNLREKSSRPDLGTDQPKTVIHSVNHSVLGLSTKVSRAHISINTSKDDGDEGEY